jgi:hypothetical protein
MAHEEEKDLAKTYLDMSQLSEAKKEALIGHELGSLIILEGLRNGDPLLLESGKLHVREAVDREIDAVLGDTSQS